MESGVLFGPCDETFAVGNLRFACCHNVEMIQHEAIHIYCKVFFFGSAQNLRSHKRDRLGVLKQFSAAVGAERQEISMEPNVIE